MAFLSARGAEFIARFEGCVLHPYNDPAGHATIGVGHLLHLGAVTKKDIDRWGTISRRRAMQLLMRDVREAADAVEAHIHVPLSQAQQDALVSFAFNCGGGALAGSVGRAVNARKDPTVALEQWCHAGGQVLQGLLARRRAEAILFTRGDYGDGVVVKLPHTDSSRRPERIPRWAWAWAQWRLGRGPFAGRPNDPKLRGKTGAPARIPSWAWPWFKEKFGKGGSK